MPPGPFRLSGQLRGHRADVRAVVAPSDDVVFSASRDGTARQWNYDSSAWQPGPLFASYHEGFVNSAAYAHINGAEYLLTGGQDALIHVWPIPAAAGDQTPAYTLLGHGLNVCCLDVDRSGRIVSGSWDMTAKIWRNFQLETTLTGHGQAVWAVLAIEPSSETGDQELTLTACADKFIRVFRGTSDTASAVLKGHQQPVRALTRMAGERFASAGNDGSVRIWTFAGEAITTLDGHESFVYSLCSLPDGSLASGGEDRSVRVWRGSDGQCEQVIVLPAISVWTVASTPGGDIVAGTSDGVVSVFTRRPERTADEVTLKMFEDSVSATAINANQVGDVKKSDLPGLDALEKQGKKEGEVIMVKNGLNVEAHQWSANSRSWSKIGDVVDAVGSGRKQLYKGVEYDYVFDVDVKEGSPPLKLPYNANQNAWDAAQRFLQENELPSSYADQVVEFIEKNTGGVSLGSSGNQDPYTGAGSYRSSGPQTNGNHAGFQGDPYTGSAGYRASPPESTNSSSGNATTGLGTPAATSGPRALPHRTPLTFTQANLPALANKIRQLNEQLASTHAAVALSAAQLSSLDRLPNPPPNDTLQKLLEWPPASRFPGLDLVRILNLPDGLIDSVLAALSTDGASEKEVDTNTMLALRGIANAVAQGALLTPSDASMVLQRLQRLEHARLAKTGKIALATVALNYSVSAVTGKLKAGGVELIDILSSLLKDSDPEVGYRSLVACGNILLSSGLSTTVTPEIAQSLQAVALDAGKHLTEPRARNLIAEIASL